MNKTLYLTKKSIISLILTVAMIASGLGFDLMAIQSGSGGVISDNVYADDEELAPGFYKAGTNELIESWDDSGVTINNLDENSWEKNESSVAYHLSHDKKYRVDKLIPNSPLINVKIVLPNSTSEISDYSFKNCKNVTEVVFHKMVSAIGAYTFEGCEKLETLTFIPMKMTMIVEGEERDMSSYTVGEFGEGAFKDCTALEKVEIFSTITEISDKVFEGCSNLKEVKLHDMITDVGSESFKDCTSLETIEFSGQLATIGDNTFEGCKKLTNVTLPGEMTTVGKEVFKDCIALEELNMPESITSLGEGTFSGCTNLVSAVLPTGITEIPDKTFLGCSSLKKVNADEGKEEASIFDGVKTIGESAFEECSNLTSVTMPESVIEIKKRAFFNCIALENLDLSSKLEIIGEEAFSGDTEIKNEIKIPITIDTVGKNAFKNVKANLNIDLGKEDEPLGEQLKGSEDWGIDTANITWLDKWVPWIAEDNKLIYDKTEQSSVEAWSGYDKEKMEISGTTSATDAGTYFATFTLKEGAGDYWGDGSTSKTVKWKIYKADPEDISVVLEKAEWTEIDDGDGNMIPTEVTTEVDIAGNDYRIPFDDGKRNTRVKVKSSSSGEIKATAEGDGLAITNVGAMYDKATDMYNSTITLSITRFQKKDVTLQMAESDNYNASNKIVLHVCDCTGLEEVTICTGVILVGDYAFKDNKTLKRVIFDDLETHFEESTGKILEGQELEEAKDMNLGEIGKYAFEGCSAIEEFNFPVKKTEDIINGIALIDEGAFKDCISLKKIKLPESLSKVDKSVFEGCTNLEEVDMSDSNFTSIEEKAFKNCVNLGKETGGLLEEKKKVLEIPVAVETIADNAFEGCKALQELRIIEPETEVYGGIKCTIGNYAFKDCESLEKVEQLTVATSIGDYAFEGCKSMTFKEIELSDNLQKIGVGAFQGLKNYSKEGNTELLPEEVQELEKEASDKKIYLSSKIESVGVKAFENFKGQIYVQRMRIELFPEEQEKPKEEPKEPEGPVEDKGDLWGVVENTQINWLKHKIPVLNKTLVYNEEEQSVVGGQRTLTYTHEYIYPYEIETGIYNEQDGSKDIYFTSQYEYGIPTFKKEEYIIDPITGEIETYPLTHEPKTEIVDVSLWNLGEDIDKNYDKIHLNVGKKYVNEVTGLEEYIKTTFSEENNYYYDQLKKNYPTYQILKGTENAFKAAVDAYVKSNIDAVASQKKTDEENSQNVLTNENYISTMSTFSATDAGTYYVYFYSEDGWGDGDIDGDGENIKRVSWTIEKATPGPVVLCNKPNGVSPVVEGADEVNLTFDLSNEYDYLDPKTGNPTEEYYKNKSQSYYVYIKGDGPIGVEGTTSGKYAGNDYDDITKKLTITPLRAGNETLYAYMKEGKNYKASEDAVKINVKVEKTIKAPSLKSAELTYTGEIQFPEWNYFDASILPGKWHEDDDDTLYNSYSDIKELLPNLGIDKKILAKNYYIASVSGTSGTEPGEYEAVFKLDENVENIKWEKGATFYTEKNEETGETGEPDETQVVVKWSILAGETKTLEFKKNNAEGETFDITEYFEVPYKSGTKTLYAVTEGDGQLTVSDYDKSKIKVETDGKYIDITPISKGETTITVGVAAGSKYSALPTEKKKTIKIKVTDKKIKVPVPEADLTYNGKEQEVKWTDLETDFVTIGGVFKAVNAGTYQAVFTLKDQANTMWDTSTPSDKGEKNVEWKIGKSAAGAFSVNKDTVNLVGIEDHDIVVVSRIGDGKVRAVSNEPKIAATYVQGNNIYIISKGIGEAEITVSVEAGDNTEGCTNTKVIKAIVREEESLSLTKNETILEYGGTNDEVGIITNSTGKLTASAEDSNVAEATCDGKNLIIKPKNAGTTTITVKAAKTETTKELEAKINVTVNKKKLTVPTQKGTLTYNKEFQTPEWNDYNSNYLKISGQTNGKIAGNYNAIFELKNSNNTVWSDESTDSKTVTWTIGKSSNPEDNSTYDVIKITPASGLENNMAIIKESIGGKNQDVIYFTKLNSDITLDWQIGKETDEGLNWTSNDTCIKFDGTKTSANSAGTYDSTAKATKGTIKFRATSGSNTAIKLTGTPDKGSAGKVEVYVKIVPKVTVSSAENGTIKQTNPTGENSGYKLGGTSYTYEFTPNTGYKVQKIFVNGKDVTSSATKITGSEGKYKYVFSNIAVDEYTLSATFSKINYNITYNLDGGTNSVSNPATYTINDSTFQLMNPTKKGYDFAGWYKSSTFNSQDKVTQVTKGSTGDIKLYAKWIIKEYNITYYTNGGTNASGNPSKYTVTTNTITLKDPTRENYKFKGWFTTGSYEDGTQITQITKGSAGNIDLFAKWEEAKEEGGDTPGTSGDGGNGGGGGADPVTNNIITTGGHATISKTTGVEKGETVTITVEPGYKVEVVNNKTNKAITLTPAGTNTYTFKMPADEITVKTVVDPDYVNPNPQGFVPKEVPEGYEKAKSFKDVNETDWFYDSINYVYYNGLMNGMTEDEFGPLSSTSRAMIVTILARMNGVQTATGEEWYKPAIEWGVANGITDGTNPTANITREEIATMLKRYAKSLNKDSMGTIEVPDFADKSTISTWASEAVTWSCSVGILKGVPCENGDVNMNPKANASRAEVATMLMRFCENILK